MFAVLAVLTACEAANAEPLRILIDVSHSRGGEGELPLQHATEDGDRVRRVLTSLGGVPQSAALRLVDPNLSDLDVALSRARALAAGHAPEEVTLFFYFSGHGDRDRVHLGDESLAMSDLMARLRAVPAGLRVVVTDACRNYPTRNKGITTEPGFAVRPAEGAARGLVWLYASGEGEAAQESDELAGAVFTHYWVSGLRGAADSNGDGRVTLAESYDFAYSQTLWRSSRGSGVLQHPAATLVLRESAPLVLTTTAGGATALRLPAEADAHYLVYATGARAVVGELWSSPERSTTFAVPPGRYLVERLGPGGGARAAEVKLAPGEQRDMSAGDFRDVALEQVALKGGETVLRPNEVRIAGGFGASRITDREGDASLGYSYHFDAWALSFGVVGALGVQHTAAENVRVGAAGLEASFERRFALSPFVLAAGLGAEGRVVWQTLERIDADRVALAGYPTSRRERALAGGPVAIATLRFPLDERAWVEANGRAGLSFAEFGSEVGTLWSARVMAAAGWSF